MVDELGKALQGIHTKQQEAVAEAQKGLEELVARQEQHDVALKGQEAKAEESRVAYEAKVEVEKGVEAEAKEAKQRLTEAKEGVEALEREKAAVLKEQEAFEKASQRPFSMAFSRLRRSKCELSGSRVAVHGELRSAEERHLRGQGARALSQDLRL